MGGKATYVRMVPWCLQLNHVVAGSQRYGPGWLRAVEVVWHGHLDHIVRFLFVVENWAGKCLLGSNQGNKNLINTKRGEKKETQKVFKRKIFWNHVPVN